ncbi:hypothetical protein J437_LFUL007263 [Ladona fulva]|uniref:Uncharacterized protein n=1 Tax=Ladona fulva TaxID=123851 RepID=A0A8K0JXW1_LADFU|nr:hypothetical protein J437_LFUL007263 [Ladona fulva]
MVRLLRATGRPLGAADMVVDPSPAPTEHHPRVADSVVAPSHHLTVHLPRDPVACPPATEHLPSEEARSEEARSEEARSEVDLSEVDLLEERLHLATVHHPPATPHLLPATAHLPRDPAGSDLVVHSVVLSVPLLPPLMELRLQATAHHRPLTVHLAPEVTVLVDIPAAVATLAEEVGTVEVVDTVEAADLADTGDPAELVGTAEEDAEVAKNTIQTEDTCIEQPVPMIPK